MNRQPTRREVTMSFSKRRAVLAALYPLVGRARVERGRSERMAFERRVHAMRCRRGTRCSICWTSSVVDR